MYYLLLDCRSAFLDEQGPLARFARDKVRAILRPTRTYGALLQESYHPDMLRDALVREQLFDRLWMEVDEQPYLMRVIPSEQADLWHGDVPIFSTQPGSRHLWDSRGICLEYFFEESGVDLVKQRLMQLSKKDLDKQLWFVRAALTTLKSDGLQTINEQRTIHPVNADISNTLDRDLFLSEACALGDKLELLAFRGKDNGVSWHVLSPVGQHWHLMPTSIDLYSGISGITLFLAYLGEISGEEQYTKLAQSALQTILRLATDSRARLKSVGAFDGWGGIIYTLSHLGKLWNQPHLINEAREIVELLPALIEQDKSLDIIGGSAGCIQSILSLYSLASSKQILDVAIQCGNKLITNAQTQATGVGWQAHISTLQPLSGLSHGAAGIALALLSLAEKTGEGRFRDTALAAQTYERSLFCKETNNWYAPRDFGKVNTGTKDNGTQTTWCYGAPGIALAHLATLYYLDNREIRAEINTALLTTLQDGWGMGHSLCHGDLGNLEALLVASEVLQESIWMQKAQRIGHTTVDSIRHQGTICGTPLGVETPGLMVGLAGIGYGLLRLAAPDRVPSLLSLSPPK
jgi:type 2 lantibiotic biosynthesis protein LanM